MKRSRSLNKECSIARAMQVVGDRWSILLLREAYYGTRRFDEFQYYLGVAPNILSTRLKKFVDLGMMTRVPLPEHSGRYEYVLTEKGRDFFPTYLALKKWGDDWLAEPEGPQVVFRDRASGRPIEYPDSYQPADLARLSLLLPVAPHGYRRIVERVIQPLRIEPNVVLEVVGLPPDDAGGGRHGHDGVGG